MYEEEEYGFEEEEEYDELAQIIKDSNDFILKNKRKYHIYKQIHTYMRNLTQDTFQEALEFIQTNFNLFFTDHSSAINFFSFVINSIISNITHLELIFDILLHFREDFKNLKVTENEIFKICITNITYVNYLFHHKFISIETIVLQATYYPLIFINYFPEIQEYDQKMAQCFYYQFFHYKKDEDYINLLLKKFKNLVESDINQHIKNRQLNYHPSPLHKAIREDNIDEFQSIIAKNQIDINYSFEYSFYERSEQNSKNSLIQVATIYNSQKICKFLLMQPNFQIDQNMLSYAYTSYNFELIHQYEKLNCSLDDVACAPIILHQKDLLTYYLENFSDHMSENDEIVKNATDKIFDEEENIFYKLKYKHLIYALASHNYSVIKKCLPKIVFILKNVEINRYNPSELYQSSILSFSAYDFDLFKFLYYQLVFDPSDSKKLINFLKKTSELCLSYNYNDAFKFLYNEIKELFTCETIFIVSITENHDILYYFFDLQIKEIKENVHLNESSMYSFFMKYITPTNAYNIVKYNDEELFVKYFELYHSTLVDEVVTNFAMQLRGLHSDERIISIIEKVPYLQKSNNVMLNELKKDLHIL